jgi:hypothetical protein
MRSPDRTIRHDLPVNYSNNENSAAKRREAIAASTRITSWSQAELLQPSQCLFLAKFFSDLTVSDAKAASFGKEDFFRIILP